MSILIINYLYMWQKMYFSQFFNHSVLTKKCVIVAILSFYWFSQGCWTRFHMFRSISVPIIKTNWSCKTRVTRSLVHGRTFRFRFFLRLSWCKTSLIESQRAILLIGTVLCIDDIIRRFICRSCGRSHPENNRIAIFRLVEIVARTPHWPSN